MSLLTATPFEFRQHN